MGKRILDMFRRDVVLTVSLVLAALSCLIAPPGPAYVGYIDFNRRAARTAHPGW